MRTTLCWRQFYKLSNWRKLTNVSVSVTEISVTFYSGNHWKTTEIPVNSHWFKLAIHVEHFKFFSKISSCPMKLKLQYSILITTRQNFTRTRRSSRLDDCPSRWFLETTDSHMIMFWVRKLIKIRNSLLQICKVCHQ